jgi:hypothetical protein
MTKVNFKNSVIALAISLVMVSCGGRGGNQQSGSAATTEAKTETAKVKQGVDVNGQPKTWEWQTNDKTAILPKPNGTIRIITDDYGIYSVQMFWTIDEAKAYGDILAGDSAFNVTKNELIEAGSTKVYNFKGTKDGYTVTINEAGYGVGIFAISISK